MKKLLLVAALIFTVSTTFAQTQKNKVFFSTQFPIGAASYEGSVPSLGFIINDKVSRFGIALNGGVFLIDNLAVNAGIGFNYSKLKDQDAVDVTSLTVGLRYYALGRIPIAANYVYSQTVDDNGKSSVNLEAGYAFFVSDKLSIEPMAFYIAPLDGGVKSSAGLKVGFSLFF